MNAPNRLPRLNRRVEIPLVIGLLLLAGVLRMAWPGLTEFKADEARLMTLAWEMAQGQTFPLRGISSSVGIPNFPVNVWLYALPLAVVDHLFAPTIFTGLLNTAAVGLCYLFVRRYWGWRAGLVAALLFAVSPWAVAHSRKIWAQNLIPIFAVGWGFSAALVYVDGRKKWMLVHLLCAAVAFQIHLAAVSLCVGSLVLMVVFRRRVPWRWVLTGAGAGLLTAVPFLFHLIPRMEDVVYLLTAGTGSDGGDFSWNAVTHTVRLATGWQIHALAGPQAFEQYLAALPPMAWVWWLWGAFMVGGLVLMARRHDHGPTRIVLIWLAVAVATFLYFPTSVELHYLLPTYPTLFIAAGVAFDRLPRWVGWRGWAVLLISAGAQVWAWIVLLLFVSQTHTPGGFGTPLAYQLQTAAAVRNQLRPDSGLLIVGDGTDPAVNSFAAVQDWHFRHVSKRRFVDGAHSAVFPAGSAVVLVGPLPAPAADLYREAATDTAVLGLRPGEGAHVVHVLPGEAAPVAAVPFEPMVLLSNWVNLLGYDPLTADGRWRVYWRVGEAVPVDFHLSNQLYDADGNRIAQADAAVFPAHQWLPGDVVVSRFTLPAPDEAARPWLMRTGFYRYPSLEPVPILDEAANPAGDAVEIAAPTDP